MSIWQALILGIVQGLTEFLPISSTAHLYVVPALLGWERPSTAYVAVIQLGTLVAVLLYFRVDILRITRDVFTGLWQRRPLDTFDARLGWMIAVGTLPVVVFGLAFKNSIETTLRSLYVISAAAIGLALLLALAEGLVWRRDNLLKEAEVRRRPTTVTPPRELEQLTWRDAIGVGFAQAVALIPGASRSGVTITGGLFLGLNRSTAARFSFLLSLPAVFAAGVLELWHWRHELFASQADVMNLLVATAVAGVVGYATIAFLLNYLRRHSTWVFIIYRLILGFTLLVLLARGILSPEV
jgi:undecaprenyl-diphosphatase